VAKNNAVPEIIYINCIVASSNRSMLEFLSYQ